jgi:hypothetical protein
VGVLLFSWLELILLGTHKKSIFGNPLTTAVIGTCAGVGTAKPSSQKNDKA